MWSASTATPSSSPRLCRGDVRHPRARACPSSSTKGLAGGRLTFTTSYEHAIPEAEFIFLAVDTPSTLVGAADLRNIRSATRVDRRIAQRHDADHRQQEHLADRHRRDDRGPARRGAGRPERRAAHREQPRVPAARATPSTTSSTRTGSSSAPAIARRRPRRLPPCTTALARRAHPDRPADRRDDQVRRQLVPGHAHLVHQRGRPPVRGHRRRRRRGRRRHRRPTRASAATSSSRASATAGQLPAQGRRRAALHRRGHGRRHAGPVGASSRSTTASALERGPPPPGAGSGPSRARRSACGA